MKVLRESRLWSAIRCTVIGDPMFSITHSRVACRLARVGVIDVDAADAAAGPVRKEAYGRPDPQVASTMIGTPRLAFPELLVEVKFIARV
ncbi:hypothetical protein [Streptomyces niveus]|uniref:hypothetical protein n=1 Tax=Streptomyces niveus TaxID=193462 RepID=UPI0036D2DB1D